MEMHIYLATFYTEMQADWIVSKLLSFGIEAWRSAGPHTVCYKTIPRRKLILDQLFKWWNGEADEWWSYFDNSWRWKPGACVEAMRYGSEIPNPFAFNDEMKQKYRDRHARRHGN